MSTHDQTSPAMPDTFDRTLGSRFFGEAAQ